MKKILFIIIAVIPLIFTGCVRKDVTEAAAECYMSGDYEAAEDYFTIALSEQPDNVVLRIGHGYNLRMLGQEQEAVIELYPVFIGLYNEGTGSSDLSNAAGALLDIFIENGMYDDASDVLAKLVERIPDCMKDEVRQLQRAMIREGQYRDDPEALERWIEAMEDIISIKAYAEDDWITLLDVIKHNKTDEEYLLAVDKYIIYMNGHSAFLEDYAPMIDIIFDAAKVAPYSTHVKDSEDYYLAAEQFLSLAESKGMAEQTLMKYRISLAERRGKTETALKLLGVYLTHFPDDEMAAKEKSYIQNRLGY